MPVDLALDSGTGLKKAVNVHYITCSSLVVNVSHLKYAIKRPSPAVVPVLGS